MQWYCNSANKLTLGSSVTITGSICTTHTAETELHPDSIEIIGTCDSVVSYNCELLIVLTELHKQEYPFKAHGRHPLEYLRHFPHLRPKTREFSSLLRIRNAAAMTVHAFFQACSFTSQCCMIFYHIEPGILTCPHSHHHFV